MSKSRWLLVCIMLGLSAHADASDRGAPAISGATALRNDAGSGVQSGQGSAALYGREVEGMNIEAGMGEAGKGDAAKSETPGLHDTGSISTSRSGLPMPKHLDVWLMLLVAAGLVVLQLRRKQKTLPQRPLADSENKVFWG